MPFSHLRLDHPREDLPLHGISSEFVMKAFSYLGIGPPRKDIPSHEDVPLHGYSSEFVSKAMARLVKPIDPNDPERYPSDMTVICGSINVKAHSHVLCEDSSYFKVICKGGFLEEQTKTLKLPAEEEFMVRRLLCYRYTTNYNDRPYDDEETPPQHIKAPAYVSRLYLNAQMYSMGDKYDIPSLKEKAAEKFDDAIQEYTRAASLVEEIIEVVPFIFGSTPDNDRRLRDRVVVVTAHGAREFDKHPDMQDLVAAVPGFVKEVRRVLLSWRYVVIPHIFRTESGV